MLEIKAGVGLEGEETQVRVSANSKFFDGIWLAESTNTRYVEALKDARDQLEAHIAEMENEHARISMFISGYTQDPADAAENPTKSLAVVLDDDTKQTPSRPLAKKKAYASAVTEEVANAIREFEAGARISARDLRVGAKIPSIEAAMHSLCAGQNPPLKFRNDLSGSVQVWEIL